MVAGLKKYIILFVACAVLFMQNLPLSAQDFSGLARIDTAASSLRATDRGASLRLRLSQGVPWRAYTLDGPPRLVLDFREVDFSGLNTGDFVQTDQVLGLRFGMVRPGVSRLVAELAAPLALAQAAMTVLPDTGVAEINIDLQEVDKETFSANSGVLRDPAFDLPDSATPPTDPAPVLGDGPVVVVLDPGHGGIDPGAQRGGESEKNLMLAFARELRDTLRRVGGFEVVLTREDDRFVSLERRIAIAHQARAHLFLSLHADALGQGQGQASGATVYLLDRNASDEATRLLAERHDRDDLVSGIDLRGQDDVIADILMDLARQETGPRAEVLAHSLVAGMQQAGGPVNSHPIRRADFSVLKAADIPSVLVEVGFLSSPRDLKNLTNPEWRLGMAQGIARGIQAWVIADMARAGLRRR